MGGSKKKEVVSEEDLEKLTTEQCEFIYRKVRILGSIAQVERSYRKKDAVGLYARRLAQAMYGKEEPDGRKED